MYYTRGVYIVSEGEEDLFDKSFRVEKTYEYNLTK